MVSSDRWNKRSYLLSSSYRQISISRTYWKWKVLAQGLTMQPMHPPVLLANTGLYASAKTVKVEGVVTEDAGTYILANLSLAGSQRVKQFLVVEWQ